MQHFTGPFAGPFFISLFLRKIQKIREKRLIFMKKGSRITEKWHKVVLKGAKW